MNTLFGEQTIDLAGHLAFAEKLRMGEVTADQTRTHFETLVKSETGIKAELAAMTIADMNKRWRLHNDTKPRLIKTIWSSLLSQCTAPCKEISGWYPMSEEYDVALRRTLATLTDEQIQEYALDIRARRESFKRAITDPQTLPEYRIYLQVVKGEDGLTDDQLAEYDYLIADAHLERLEQQWQRQAQVKQVEMGDTAMSIKKGWHTKQGCDIWIVQLSERVDRDTFNELAEKAKKFGVRWSSFGAKENHGFIFFNEADAQTFTGLQEGDVSLEERWERREEERQERVVERLNGKAERLEETAESTLNHDRLTNTAKRAREALSAEANAHEQQRVASVLSSIADALEQGKLRYLQHIVHATHVELLDSLLLNARDKAVEKENGGKYVERDGRRPAKLSDIRFVEWPHPVFRRGWLDDTKGVKGIIRHTERLTKALKKADYIKLDTPDLMESAQALLDKVGTKNLRWLYESMAPHKRLVSMRISGIHMLRAALREYLLHRQEKVTKVDGVKLMEYDLIGRKIPGFFPTPPDLAQRMVEVANIGDGWVLEPSAGKGNIAEAIFRVTGIRPDCLEVDYSLRQILEAKGFALVGYDFLEFFQGEVYDYILMNPPFEDGQDILHVQHAYDNLNHNGRLVAIMSEGPFFRQDGRATAFRAWLDGVGGTSEKLPDGSFRESGTNVATRLVVIDKGD